MKTTNQPQPSKTKTIVTFILTILIGYILFIIPDIFFGVTKLNGGKVGVNLIFIALFRFIAIVLLLRTSLKILQKDWKYIGLTFTHLKKDILLGAFFGIGWAVLQFTWLIPQTGGAARADIQGMLQMYDGSLLGTVSFIILGVIGGGIAEELFNRGYYITVLKDIFKNPKVGLWFAAILSILTFSLGHLPTNGLEWFDILVPTIIYTVLFIKTERLTAPMVAHGIYNLLAIVATYMLYYS